MFVSHVLSTDMKMVSKEGEKAWIGAPSPLET